MSAFPIAVVGRSKAIDVFRGLTVMAMIVVNMPGNPQAVYPGLDHAPWNGLTFTDLVFPFFLFVVGVSTQFSITRKRAMQHAQSAILSKAAKRAAVLFMLGVALNLMFKPTLAWEMIRWCGVLQRIALVFFACAVCVVFLRTRVIGGLAFAVVLVYHVLMLAASGWDASTMTPEHNPAQWLDSQWVPGRLLHGTWDPEGLVTTIPAIATGLFGVVVGRILSLCFGSRNADLNTILVTTAPRILIGLGGGFILFAWVAHLSMPINKNLWSSSYTLLTASLACFSIAVLVWLIDVRHVKGPWLSVPLAFGANAMAAYVLHTMMIAVFIRKKFTGGVVGQWVYDHALMVTPTAPMASLVCALFYLGVCTLPILWMYKRGIVWKI